MSQVWYVKQNGKSSGPITAAQLKQLAGASKIGPKTQVRLGDQGSWVDAMKVKGLFSTAVAAPQSKGTTPQPVRPKARESKASHDPTPRLSPAQRDSGHPYQPPAPIDETVNREMVTPAGKSVDGIGAALRSIWFQPRKTIRWAIDCRPGRDAIILIMIAFSLKYLDNVLSGDSESLVLGLVGSVVGIPLSALIGVLSLYVMGFMHKIIGAAFGGSGDAKSLRTAFAWSFAPVIFSFPLTVLLVCLFITVPQSHAIPDVIVMLPFWILGLWGLVIQIAGISAAHQFSILRAFATFVVTVVVLVLALLITVQGIVMLTIG